MTPGKYNIVVGPKERFKLAFNWTAASVPVNLAGYTAKFLIAYKEQTTPVVSLTTLNGAVVLGGATHNVVVDDINELCDALKSGVHKYELTLTDSAGFAYWLLEGNYTVPAKIIPL